MTTNKKVRLKFIEGEREALEDELMNKLLSLAFDNEDVETLIAKLKLRKNHLSTANKETIH